MKAVAKSAELPERVVKVVVAQLQSMGIVERSARGSRPLRTFRDAAELEAFVTSYEERFQDDREKLDTMMTYAQSTGCRVARILAYFGQPDRGACGHCDNCRDGQMVAAPVSEPVASHVRGRGAAADAQAAAGLVVGAVVNHRAFGTGVVRAVEEGRAEVEFEWAGVRTVRANFLREGMPASRGVAGGARASRQRPA